MYAKCSCNSAGAFVFSSIPVIPGSGIIHLDVLNFEYLL